MTRETTPHPHSGPDDVSAIPLHHASHLRQILGVLPVAIYTIKVPTGQITYYNEEAASLWGRRPELGETHERWCGSFRLWLPDGSPLPHDQTPMVEALKGLACRDLELVVERPDASRVTVLANIDPILDEEGRVVGAMNVFQDVTAQQQIRSLFKRLISAHEAERRRICDDIHDQLGQQMTALRKHMDAWRSNSTAVPELMSLADQTLTLAEQLDRNIDQISWDLRPAALHHLGLPATLRDLVADWSARFGIVADFESVGDNEGRLPRDVADNVYRVVQEALHNVQQHADATHVVVIISRWGGHTTVIIEDDGVGFTPAASGVNGLGLANMRERAALLGGTLQIESSPGHGTTVIVRLTDGTPVSMKPALSGNRARGATPAVAHECRGE